MKKMEDNNGQNKRSMNEDMDKILSAKESISGILAEWGPDDIAKLPRHRTDNARKILVDVSYDEKLGKVVVKKYHGIIKDGSFDVTLEKDAKPFFEESYTPKEEYKG